MSTRSTRVADEPLSIRRQKYADSIADYVMTHERIETLSQRDVALATVRVMLDDIGAAQGFLDAIGVKVDLYGCR